MSEIDSEIDSCVHSRKPNPAAPELAPPPPIAAPALTERLLPPPEPLSVQRKPALRSSSEPPRSVKPTASTQLLRCCECDRSNTAFFQRTASLLPQPKEKSTPKVQGRRLVVRKRTPPNPRPRAVPPPLMSASRSRSRSPISRSGSRSRSQSRSRSRSRSRSYSRSRSHSPTPQPKPQTHPPIAIDPQNTESAERRAQRIARFAAPPPPPPPIATILKPPPPPKPPVSAQARLKKLALLEAAFNTPAPLLPPAAVTSPATPSPRRVVIRRPKVDPPPLQLTTEPAKDEASSIDSSSESRAL